MRKAIILLLIFLSSTLCAQTHIEYISEKQDSMALINKEDIDIINKVFNERNVLDSVNILNDKIIQTLEEENVVKDSIISKQNQTIENNILTIEELETRNSDTEHTYQKKLKSEKRKSISFQTLTGAGIVAIILLILL